MNHLSSAISTNDQDMNSKQMRKDNAPKLEEVAQP